MSGTDISLSLYDERITVRPMSPAKEDSEADRQSGNYYFVGLDVFDTDGDSASVALTRQEALKVADALYVRALPDSGPTLTPVSELSANEALIRVAALHKRKIWFQYTGRDRPVAVTVSAFNVFSEHTTFTGFDLTRNEYRSFRTDRIVGDVEVGSATP